MEISANRTDRPIVTLDLWLTLVAEVDGTQQSQRRFEARARLTREVVSSFGIHVDEEPLVEASKQISQMITSDHDLGIDLEFNERVVQMLTLVDPEIPGRLAEDGIQTVADAIDRAFLKNPPTFLPGSKEVLEQLRGMDLAVALISNTGMTSAQAYREWFTSEGVLDQFHTLTFSNEIACAKPNPNIFNPTLETAGALAENGLHIGDNLLTDISGAAGVGMKTGWIQGHDDREPIVEPDYTLESIADLPEIVDQWFESRRPLATS